MCGSWRRLIAHLVKKAHVAPLHVAPNKWLVIDLHLPARACRDYGQRVQYSVFEIEVDPAQWTSSRAKLENLITPEHDSLRYYFLGANWRRRVEHVGAKPAVDLGGPLIV